MITLQQHIDQQHGGNVTAFAKSVGRSRPLAYRWLRDGALWINGRVHDPVTAPTTITDAIVQEQPLVPPGHWQTYVDEVIINSDPYDMKSKSVHLNAADLAAMTEALNNEN